MIEFGRSILDRARADTLAKVTPLPDGEGVDSFTGVRDVFYSGRSAYTGNYRGWLHFNVDKDWQRDVFVQVLCHEAYPGHQTFYTLWDELFRAGRWPVEAAFYTRNAPTNPIFEGGPEVAMHLIGWDVGDTREALGLRMGQVYKDLGRIAMNDCLPRGQHRPDDARGGGPADGRPLRAARGRRARVRLLHERRVAHPLPAVLLRSPGGERGARSAWSTTRRSARASST